MKRKRDCSKLPIGLLLTEQEYVEVKAEALRWGMPPQQFMEMVITEQAQRRARMN